MRSGEAAQPEQRRCDGRARLLREAHEQLARSGSDDALAGEDQRPLARVDQRGSAIEIGWRRLRHLAAGARRRTVAGAEIERRLLRVLGNVDVHRSGTTGSRQVERLAQRRVDVLGARDQVVVLGDRQRDAGNVRLLERVGAEHGRGDLAGDAHDGRRVHHRRGDAGDEIGGAGSRGRDGDANLAGSARVAVRHVRRALLVSHEHVPDGERGERVVGRHDRAARIAEDGLDALADESFPDRL